MKRFFGGVLLILILSGCIPRQMPSTQPNQDVVATLVAATLAGESEVTQEPHQPPETEGTPLPPSPSPTDTNTPTLTLTYTPTVTDTPEAVPGDPVLSLGVPTFKDTFEDDDNFYTYDEAQSSYLIDDGQFILIAKKANGYETWSLSWGDLKNFYLEITGTFGDECGGKDRYGLIFRAPDTSQGYLLSIS